MWLIGARRRLRSEAGFTIVAVTSFMMVGMLFAIVAISVATGDLSAGRGDQDRKRAYAAAEAGINDYIFQLSQDADYWTRCDGVPAPNAVNQPLPAGTAASRDTMRTRPVPGTTDAFYGIELVPAPGQSACVPGVGAETSMIEAGSGTFRIRSTGMVRGRKRSIVATFRRRSFLDFIYFTDFETNDPALVSDTVESRNPPFSEWYAATCATNYWWGPTGRSVQRYPGEFKVDGNWVPYAAECGGEIQFGNNDRVLGPFHTNDTVLVSGSPRFGRETRPAGSKDAVEVSGPAPGWRGSGSTPVFNTESGQLTPNSTRLEMPPDNVGLRTIAQNNGLLLTGRSTIELGTTQMKVNGVTVPFPANGVIYVQNAQDAACGAYDREQRYDGDPACGDIYVKGTYNRDLTIASQNDIVVYGDLRRDASAQSSLLGLIADNFVRVYHPCPASSTPTWGSTSFNVTIDAAILALNHSFLVDNYYCGAAQGTLTVNGAISQKYRGPVGTSSGGSITRGYTKSYQYNDRLRFRSPPRFLDPVQSSWRILRNTEQVPAK